MAATERLITSEGSDVSTRAIAEAAGIAEGTIFRVFPTKNSIIDAIFEDAFDPEGGGDELAAVNRDADLETCLTELVTILQKRIERVVALVSAVGLRQPISPANAQNHRKLSFSLVAEILENFRPQLRGSPEETARTLHGLVLAMTHPMLTDQPIKDSKQIVDIALHGIARSSAEREAEQC